MRERVPSASPFTALVLACAAGAIGFGAECASGDSPGDEAPRSAPPRNIALGAAYALEPPPNYPHSTDPEDSVQLTDGVTTTAYFWTQRGTVGWTGARYAAITIDLGRLEPIAGASLETAAGTAGVTWPAAIPILVSDDGSAYREAGDLVALDRKARGGWPEGYAIRKLVTMELRTRGRFVRFLILPEPGGPYIFVDEVEVFRGPEDFLAAEPPGPVVRDPEDLFRRIRVRSCVARRFEADAAALREAIRALGPEGSGRYDAAARDRLLERAEEAARRLDPESVRPDASFRAVLPIGEAHAALFEVQAEAWSAAGLRSLSAWPANPWDPLVPFGLPAPGAAEEIEIHALRGEVRAGALNVASAAGGPRELRVEFEGLPRSPAPEYVTIREVRWTDTAKGRPVAAALPEAEREGRCARVHLVPGLPGQVWLEFQTRHLEPGAYAGVAILEGEGASEVRVPVRLRVYPLDFPERPSLLVGGWSYTNGRGSYGVTPQNREAFIRHLRERFVNAPWATSSVLLRCRFAGDVAGGIELDASEFDSWIADWPDACAYMVFLAVGDYGRSGGVALGDALPGSPDFERRAGLWISAWARHLGSRRIETERLALLIHDEPHEGSDLRPFLAWARAIRRAEPRVRIWEDPTYRDPAKAPREFFEACDILCPNRPMWIEGGRPFQDVYLEEARRGKTLHFYSCSGPAKLLDPYAYYRLQAWECFCHGARGSFFWAFGDGGGASSWNEYLARAGPYTPLFLDEATVTAGKHMEAIRESVEDYETLAILRRAAEEARAAGRAGAAVAEAEAVLAQAAREVLEAEGASHLSWHDPKDRSAADRVRVRALQALQALRGR
ncbi:MAG: hypothetical protein ACUVYA_03100 [Planctomycetota bacterium]